MQSTSRDRLAWVFLAVLAISCGVLGLLQYRWIGEIGSAERDRLRESLRSRMDAFSRALNNELASAVTGLSPNRGDEDRLGPEQAWRASYEQGRGSHTELFSGITVELPDDRDRRLVTLRGNPVNGPATLRMELFGRERGPEWILLEPNTQVLRSSVIPRLLKLYLGDEGAVDYDVAIATAGPSGEIIFTSGASAEGVREHADASIPLLDLQGFGGGREGGFRPGGRGPRGGRPGPPGPPGPGPGPPPGGRRGPPPGFQRPGLWTMYVRHHAGSLEALVTGTQRGNIAVSAGVISLILAAAAMLLLSARRAHRLADLQMQFVAGVSHELRTPLSVIRTAAYNLRDAGLRARPEHVEKYGRLIESESTRLEGLMEQVLRFAGMTAGQPLMAPEQVSLDVLITEELDLRRSELEHAGIVVEENRAPELPPVQADRSALRHAIRNLIDNALKHGAEGGWLRVSTQAILDENRTWVELRVADKGPGVPSGERSRIFEAFVRGEGALRKQVRGTGLGLSLVRMIAERHGGSVRLSNPGEGGAEFVLRLPV